MRQFSVYTSLSPALKTDGPNPAKLSGCVSVLLILSWIEWFVFLITASHPSLLCDIQTNTLPLAFVLYPPLACFWRSAALVSPDSSFSCPCFFLFFIFTFLRSCHTFYNIKPVFLLINGHRVAWQQADQCPKLPKKCITQLSGTVTAVAVPENLSGPSGVTQWLNEHGRCYLSDKNCLCVCVCRTQQQDDRRGRATYRYCPHYGKVKHQAYPGLLLGCITAACDFWLHCQLMDQIRKDKGKSVEQILL